MKNIWLVNGSTGEYSDFQTWNVIAYSTEEEAKKHVDAAQRVADEVKSLPPAKRYEAKNPHDPQFQCYYTGTRYTVELVEVREKFAS